MTQFVSKRSSSQQPSWIVSIRRRSNLIIALTGISLLLSTSYWAKAPDESAGSNPTNEAAQNHFENFWLATNFKGSSLRLDAESSMIKFPKGIKRVWVDVGVHSRSEFLDNIDADPDLFVIGFEPSIEVHKPCSHPRCVILWAASTPEAKMVELNIQGAGGLCNSLLSPNTNSSTPMYRPCIQQEQDEDGNLKKFQVPGIPLHWLLSRIPSHITVEFIKIDAQGYDLEVMKGVLPAATPPAVVSLEAMDVTDKSLFLYHGQPTLEEVKEFLKHRGWSFVAQQANPGGAVNEVNAFFVRNASLAYKVPYLMNFSKKATPDSHMILILTDE